MHKFTRLISPKIQLNIDEGSVYLPSTYCSVFVWDMTGGTAVTFKEWNAFIAQEGQSSAC